jgi:hypothetical protein
MRIEKGDKIFIVVNTLELDNELWDSYVLNANTTLGSSLSREDFHRKYTNNPKGFSYHSLIIDKISGDVVGGTSAIPVDYQYFKENIQFALSCDTFLLESHRKDFTIAYSLYNNLTKHLKNFDFPFIFGVPNEFTLYPYIKKIVKWQEIAQLPIFAIPINGPKIAKLDIPVLNYIFRKFLKLVLHLNHFLFSSKNVISNIYKKQDEGYNPNFLTEHSYKNVVFRYRIVEEKNRIAQIMYFKNADDSNNQAALLKVIDYFIETNLADVVVYIGNLPFKNHLMVNLPAKYRKRQYYFMGKIINPERVNAEQIHDFNNWSFSFNNLDIN